MPAGVFRKSVPNAKPEVMSETPTTIHALLEFAGPFETHLIGKLNLSGDDLLRLLNQLGIVPSAYVEANVIS